MCIIQVVHYRPWVRLPWASLSRMQKDDPMQKALVPAIATISSCGVAIPHTLKDGSKGATSVLPPNVESWKVGFPRAAERVGITPGTTENAFEGEWNPFCFTFYLSGGSCYVPFHFRVPDSCCCYS